MYNRMIKTLSKKTKTDMTGFTPNKITEFAEEYNGCNISELEDIFCKACYSDHEVTSEDAASAYRMYCEGCKSPKKEKY